MINGGCFVIQQNAIVKKHFWVCFTLDYLFHRSSWKIFSLWCRSGPFGKKLRSCTMRPIGRNIWKCHSVRGGLRCHEGYFVSIFIQTNRKRCVFDGSGARKEAYIINDIMEFANREEFREWLREHCLSNDGIWLLFGKAGGQKTIKAGEALEEALCFGWIDGQMEKIDDKTYKK